jgi:hypothetical protein
MQSHEPPHAHDEEDGGDEGESGKGDFGRPELKPNLETLFDAVNANADAQVVTDNTSSTGGIGLFGAYAISPPAKKKTYASPTRLGLQNDESHRRFIYTTRLGCLGHRTSYQGHGPCLPKEVRQRALPHSWHGKRLGEARLGERNPHVD